MDPGLPAVPIPGATVHLFDVWGALLQTLVADSEGVVQFNVADADYTVNAQTANGVSGTFFVHAGVWILYWAVSGGSLVEDTTPPPPPNGTPDYTLVAGVGALALLAGGVWYYFTKKKKKR